MASTKEKFIEQRPIEIDIDTFAGFSPIWFRNSYSTIGNKNQANDMVDIDIRDPNVLTQGPALTEMTAGVVSTLIRSILKTAVLDNVSYAIGGNTLYQISRNAVSNTSPFPHTITKSGVTNIDGEDVVFYKSAIYYFYNHSGNAGDIGKYDLGATFTDNWGSTIPTGKGTLEYAPHQAILGGDDNCYFTNGKYIGRINSDGTLDLQALDFWTDAQTASIAWNFDRLIIALNRPNIKGSNMNQSGIYSWDTVSPSWDGNPIEVSGRITALKVKNGITFVWWDDGGGSDYHNFGYVDFSGHQCKVIRTCKGPAPEFYQVGEYDGFLAWASNGIIYLWGAKDPQLPVNLFAFCSGKYNTLGGIGTPFGDLLVASTDGATNYSLAKPGTSYSQSAYFKTIVFKVSAGWTKFQIDTIMIETDELSTGAKVNFRMYYNKGGANNYDDLDSITYLSDDPYKTRFKILNKSMQVEDFQLKIDFSESTSQVKIRRILIMGNIVKYN